MVALDRSKFNSSVSNKSTRSNWPINPSLNIHCTNLNPARTPENLSLNPEGLDWNENINQKWVNLLK